MNSDARKTYDHIRAGGAGLFEQARGMIAVSGKEAVQFLDGLITNNVKKLGDGEQMLAAFPTAQGRLLAVVRVFRQGDRILIETAEETHAKLYQSLFRFTLAGDFFIQDVSNHFYHVQFFGSLSDVIVDYEPPQCGRVGELRFRNEAFSVLKAVRGNHVDVLIPATQISEDFIDEAVRKGNAVYSNDIYGDLYELLRIEAGMPKFGVDMDETTIVPELGLEGLISYNKGCYIGQEIIARIHFRGHVAKQLTGLVSETAVSPGAELEFEGKNAGRVTSTAFSPKLERNISLAYVRYDHLAPGTQLSFTGGTATVTELPFVNKTE